MIMFMKRLAAVVLFVFILAGLAGCNNYTEDNSIPRLSLKDADSTLSAWMDKIAVNTMDPPVDLDTNNKYIEEMPDINTSFPLSVAGNTGAGTVNVELWASTEKSGDGNDGWINRVAELFNNQKFKLSDGRLMTFSIRAIDAGAQVDYITKKDMRPDAISPANYLWGDMIASNGIDIKCIEQRLAGNTAGILMAPADYQAYVSKHGKDFNLNTIADAAINGEFVLGYTNPYASDTALNLLSQMLLAFDPQDPLSSKAEQKFNELQQKLPPPAYTTAQMRESAVKGFINVMVMERQAYSNAPTLADYVFTPMGVRHDNPVFIFGNLDPDKRAVLDKFIEFAKNDQCQKLASQMGFNNPDDANYAGVQSLSGADLYKAQALWKRNKSAKPTVCVFVADCSGSMEDNGGLASLKDSLLNAMQYIDENNYIGLVSFSDDFNIELTIDKFSGVQRGKFQSAVKGLTTRNSTYMYSGALVAVSMLRQYQETLPDANYMMILLSDGQSNGGISEKIVSQLIASYGIRVYTIGYGKDADMNELSKLASSGDGVAQAVTEDNAIYTFKNLFNAQM